MLPVIVEKWGERLIGGEGREVAGLILTGGHQQFP